MDTMIEFFFLGIEHLLTGYDHLLFLLAVILGVGAKREYVKIITAFTLGHSVTLALVALGVLDLPASFIEPIIALSILYVAVESIVKPTLNGRWVVTLIFGFIHGFGFAGLLKEYLSENVAVSLFSFNLGIEIGQLFILGLLLPLLQLARKYSWHRKASMGVSGAIAFAGIYWFVERVI
jgi:hydrogenase/urease accessory protein HupE